jgi:uncharacterized protein YndB with AHSA1/START domain
MTTVSARADVRKTIRIGAPTANVWGALTVPALMQRWMAETPIEILTGWRVGHPFLIRGHLHGDGMRFEARGQVLQFEPEQVLEYSHLSSISHLPDAPSSYTRLEFRLTAVDDEQTEVVLTLRNFPTEAIYHHLDFYWNSALSLLKRVSEQL